MIYLFGKGKDVSIVFDVNTLTEEDKVDGIAVEQLPPKEEKKGYESVLCLDDNNKPYWEFRKIPEITKDTLEDLVRKELITIEQYKTLTGKNFVG
jgi:hypothetical protein